MVLAMLLVRLFRTMYIRLAAVEPSPPRSFGSSGLGAAVTGIGRRDYCI
jgi:hypothetical protein